MGFEWVWIYGWIFENNFFAKDLCVTVSGGELLRKEVIEKSG